MPGETANFDIPYALGADKPPSVPTITKAMADRLEILLGAVDLSQLVADPEGADDGKLVIVKDGAAAYRAMSGDGTIDEDGNFQLGSKVVGTTELGDKAVTTGKVDDGAVTEGKLGDGAATSRKLKPTSGVKVASGPLSLTGAYQDVPGTTLEITPVVESAMLIIATFDFVGLSIGGTAPTTIEGLGTVRLNTSDESGPARLYEQISSGEASGTLGGSVTQVWLLSLSAAKQTIKLRGRRAAGAEGELAAGSTRFTYLLFAA